MRYPRLSGIFQSEYVPQTRYLIAGKKDLIAASPKRGKYSTKLDNGRVLVVGGNEYFHGAPALASTAAYALLAALRVGSGYAVAYVPRGVLIANRSVSLDIIVRPLSGNRLNPKDVPMLSKSIERSDCLVIGSGLGRAAETVRAVSMLLDYAAKNDKKVVVDADAIGAVKEHGRKLNMNFIITPNEREFNALTWLSPDREDISVMVKASVGASKRFGCNVLLKGHSTVVTDGKRIKIVRAKSSALATMGTGDVLSGMIGAYAAKNKDMFVAGVAGAYLHAIIGDMLHKEKGNHILASDVVDYIPKALRKYDKD